MAKHVVISHALGWVEKSDFTGALHHNDAVRGEEVELPDRVAEHFQRLTEKDGVPRIGTREDLDAWLASPESKAARAYPGGVSDDMLRQMTAEQVHAHLDQHNFDAERVLAVESEREQPRKTIVAAAEKQVEAQRQRD